MKLIWLVAVCGLSLAPAGCTSNASLDLRSPRTGLPCARRQAGFFQLPGELARVQFFCLGVAACPNGAVNLETKQIAGWINNDYLWGLGDTQTSFGVPLQNSIMADAHNRALAARPGNKSIIAIDYFTDIVVGPQPVYGYIGATVDYGDCLARSAPQR